MPAGMPGTTSKRDALLVQEQRFGAAAVEHERVAPFQPRDRLALARLLREQVADRFLLERLRRGDADVDLLRVGARVAQQPRVDEVVVQHDVGRGQVLQPADGDQARIARAGADQIHDAHQSQSQSSVISLSRQSSVSVVSQSSCHRTPSR